MATRLLVPVLVVAALAQAVSGGTRSVPSSTLARMWDRNATHIAIESLTAHQDLVEGQELSLECVVSIKEGEYDDDDDGGGGGTGASPVLVQWLLVGADDGSSGLQELASDAVVVARSADLRRRLRSVRRRSWDAVADATVQEHKLILASITEAEMGVYICQVKLRNSSVVASKHTYVTVLPRMEPLPDASPTFDPKSVTVARSEDLSTPDVDSVKDIIVVKKGRNVTLECRDADSSNEVYWRKLGDSSLVGTGRHLRLIRVEKWDSGLYLCSTSSAGRHNYNVTLFVNAEPVVTSTDRVVVQSEGGQAKLTCKVEAVPVASITWYRMLPTEALPAPHTAQAATTKRALRSNDELTITIGMYKDGVVESSLNVYSVEEKHYGTYLCEAKNSLGEDSIEISIAKVKSNSPSSASFNWTTRSQRISFTMLIMFIVQIIL